MAEAFLFYLFSSALLLAAALTLLSRNPVHSVLWLILAFLNAAGLMLMLGAEFIAMMLVIVYVGAVAILFLFVVMMLDTDAGSSRSGLARNWVVGLVAALIALIELVAGLAFWTDVGGVVREGSQPADSPMPNIEAFGRLIYTRYLLVVGVAGLILVIAIVGAVVLTKQRLPSGRRQHIDIQVRRRPYEATRIINVPVGKGIDLTE